MDEENIDKSVAAEETESIEEETEACTVTTKNSDVETATEESTDENSADSEEEKETLASESQLDNEKSDDLVEKYLEKADAEEESDAASSFERVEFDYTLTAYDIAVEEYEICKKRLDEHGYVFLSNESELKSKYFADQLLQYLDKYGNVQKSELIFCANQSSDCKHDFIDLKNYFSYSIEEELLVLDLCKFGHVQKEYFLNSFYDFLNKDGNKIILRELLAKRNLKLILVAWDKDIDKKEDLFNIHKVKESMNSDEKDTFKEDESIDAIVSKLTSDEADNTLEKVVLFIVSLFKGCTPTELQSMLYLVLDTDDQMRWKKERKKLLGKMHIVAKNEPGAGTSMVFGASLQNRETELLDVLRAEDPFFLSELFDFFEENEELLNEVLSGKKSQAFTNGFFQLIKMVSNDAPEKLALDWFIDKFENKESFSVDYLFALASCALQVSESLNDYTFLDELVNYFYRTKEILPLLYLLEYFSYVYRFDKYKWYKKILPILYDAPDRGSLFSLLYKTIYKDINTNHETLKTVLAWRGNNPIVNGYIFTILTRIASDSVKDNKFWNVGNNRMLPSLLTMADDRVVNESLKQYFEYLFNFEDISKNCTLEIVSLAVAENINKLFFTKIIGLLRFYINKEDQKRIIKTISEDIQKLMIDPYMLYETLLLLEWSFLLDNSSYVDNESELKSNILSLYLDNITKDKLRRIRDTIQLLSNILLKLSYQTRKYRELSDKYNMLRKELRNITKDMKQKSKKEEANE